MLVEENVDFLIDNSGVEWIISAVKNVIDDKSEIASKIMAAGCRSLMRLTGDEKKIYKLMQKGAVKTMVSVLQSHTDDTMCSNAALGALTKMLTR